MNGNSEGAIKLWRYATPSGPWTQFVPTSSDTTDNWVENNALTAFSPWVIPQNGPAAPTAVTLETFQADANERAGGGAGWVLVVADVLDALGAALARRRRR